MVAPYLVGGFFCLALTAVSCWLVMTALKKHRRYRQLLETPMTPVELLRPGRRAKTEGRVVALEEPLLSPMGRRDCVYYHFQVDEQRGGGKSSHWATVVNDRQLIALALDDGGAEVEVDLYGAEVEMRHAMKCDSHVFNSPPPELEHMLMRRYGTSTHGLLFNKTMRYSETVIEEGDLLVALGEVRDVGRRRLLLTGGPDGPMLVSDEHPRDLTSKYEWSRNGYAMGAGASLFGLLLALLGTIAWVVSESRNQAQQAAFNPPPPFQPQPFNPGNPPPFQPAPNGNQMQPPQGDDDPVGQALQDLRGDKALKQHEALEWLGRVPKDARQREAFEAARADEGRRKEVAVELARWLHQDKVLCGKAARALLLWVVADVVPEVIAEVENRFNTAHRAVLIAVLGASKDERAVPALEKQLLEPTYYWSAYAALHAIRGPEHVAASIAAALAKSERTRAQLCELLGKVGTEKELPALEALADDPDDRVAAAAKDAAEQIRQRRKGEP